MPPASRSVEAGMSESTLQLPEACPEEHHDTAVPSGGADDDLTYQE